MGQEELVLKIPAAAETAGSSPASAKQISSSDEEQRPPPASRGPKRTFSHSRESSGASVKFVNGSTGSNSVQGHRRTLSKCSGQSQESHVIILQTPSEDITLSDRLSLTEQGDGTDLDEEEEELRHGCEDDFHDRLSASGEYLVDDLRMRRSKNDSKSQNSDYGSFCNTPSDNFGGSSGITNSAVTSLANGSDEGRVGNVANGGEGEEPDNANNTGDGTMPQETYQREPLLNPPQDSCSSDEEMGANSSGYTRRKSRHPRNNNNSNNNAETRLDMEQETATDSPVSEIPAEPIKTLLAFIFLFFGWVATTTSLALTHERVPNIDPLPDVFLDNVTYQHWGLSASEIIIMIATMAAFVLSVFHQHRFVVLRRIFFLTGLHYFYRAITMYITVLPKADPNYICAPKLQNITFVTIASRVAKLLSGMGLSINGQHIYCGDYIYSGHTMTLLMTYLVIKEYSPRRWFLLHWLSFCTVVTGVLTLLFARGHYSIDVLIAYWITTRLWWIYHTLANNSGLTIRENKHNYLSKFWWFVIFRYFERNVGRPLPKGFNWPIPQFVIQRIPWLRNRLGDNRPTDVVDCEDDDDDGSGSGLPR